MEAGSAQSTAIRFGKIRGGRASADLDPGGAEISVRPAERRWLVVRRTRRPTPRWNPTTYSSHRSGTRDERRFQQCADEILRHQNQDGGWPIYQGGPSNVTASVKAYFALKICGFLPEERMRAPASASLPWAACPPATPSARSISAPWDNLITTRFRPFRRRLCCFRVGSGSTSTKSPPGRGRF